MYSTLPLTVALRRRRLQPLLAIALVLVLASLGTQPSPLRLGPTTLPVLAQQGGGCDSPCMIYGVGLQFGLPTVYRINTCSFVVAAHVPGGVPNLDTIASQTAGIGTAPFLTYGDAAGGRWCSGGWPPGIVTLCGTLVGNARGLAAGSTGQLYAGADSAAPFGNLHNPSGLVGAGSNFFTPESDLVCDPTGQFGLIGDALPGGVAASLFNISRADGSHHRQRPIPPRGFVYNGLAYDGYNRLWGSTIGLGGADVIHHIIPATGQVIQISPALVSVFGPLGLTDLASNECTAGCPASEADHRDLGDAPDSTNHFGATMLAYPGVTAAFPSVKDIGTGTPPGPSHLQDSQDSKLGLVATSENDADLMPDVDGMTNLDPAGNAANRDAGDDGPQFPISLPQCQLTQMNYTLTVTGGLADRYANMWFDYNRNGQWGDQIQCTFEGQVYTVSEWVVQSQLTNLGNGTHSVTSTQFRAIDAGADVWMRISVAETVAPSADGRGYEASYEVGETEDHLIQTKGGGIYE